MKKKIIILSSLIGLGIHINAQVGINTSIPQATVDITGKPDEAAVLDGLLVPRLTGNQLRAKTYTDLQNGAIVYVTAADNAPNGQTIDVKSVGYYSYNYSLNKWLPFQLGEDWNLTGNSGTTAGTNFLGTLDDQDLVFKRNNIEAGWLSTNNTAFGVGSLPTTASGSGNVALGNNSLNAMVTGVQNIGIGFNAGKGISGGSNNIAIGGNTLSTALSATIQRNIAIGDGALSSTTGNNNVVIGTNSGAAISSGGSNTIIGNSSAANLTTGSNNIALGNNISLQTATASNQMNIGNIIFGTGMNGSLAAPAGNIGINQPAPARRLDVNAAIAASPAPIRVTNLQPVAVGSPSTSTVPLVMDTATGDIYRGKSSELLISNTNIIPNATPVQLNAAGTATAIGSSSGSLYNTTFTLTRPALVSISYSLSMLFNTNTGGAITDGSPRVSMNWVKISDSTGATTIQDNLGYSSTYYSNNTFSISTLGGSYSNSSSSYINLSAGTYRIDLMGLIGCSSSQTVRAAYGGANDNLFIKVDYN